jgi:hypothetical protein
MILHSAKSLKAEIAQSLNHVTSSPGVGRRSWLSRRVGQNLTIDAFQND